MTNARLKSIACWMARAIFSPQPVEREPPRKRKSITAKTTRTPSTLPEPTTTDSLVPSFFTAAAALAA